MEKNDNEKVEKIKPVVLKVGGIKDKDYVKRLSNAICWQLRDFGACTCRAVKSEAVYNNIKAIAISNCKVKKANVLLSIDCSFDLLKEAYSTNNMVAISTIIQDSVIPRPDKFVEFRVSGDKNNKDDYKSSCKLAGAISALLRQDNGIILRCMGSASVFKAICAIAFAKKYTLKDKIAINSVPNWSVTNKINEDLINFIQIEVWGQKVQ